MDKHGLTLKVLNDIKANSLPEINQFISKRYAKRISYVLTDIDYECPYNDELWVI